MSGDLTGKFNYSSLIRTLKDNGIQNATITARKVGRDNDIDNIKEIDGSQEITIAQSIFNNAFTVDSTNPFEVQNQSAIFPFDNSYAEKLNAGKIMTDGDSVIGLPEIYNDDEYEVADYEDYYAFGETGSTQDIATGENFSPVDEVNGTEIETLPYIPGKDGETKITNLPYIPEEAGETKLETMPYIIDEQNGAKFGMFNKDANDYKNDAELVSSIYSKPTSQKKEADSTDVTEPENEDAIKDDAMDMNMQNDSFSAK